LAPDRSQALAASFDLQEIGMTSSMASPLWLVPLPAGSPRRLGDLTAFGAHWSPDGKRLAFSQDQNVFLANGDGTDAHKLVTVQGTPFHLRFSLDGRLVRFSVLDRNSATSSMWEIGVDAQGVKQLVTGWHQDPGECCGSWTPDGRYFLFSGWRAGRDGIWALGESGGWNRANSQPVEVTTGPLNYYEPLPDRDGSKVFVVGEQPRAELQRYDTHSEQFVPYLSGISAGQLAFSRDGQWVAYVSFPDWTLWRSRIDGSERTQFTYPPMITTMPNWSPDGKKIAFQGSSPAQPLLRIFVIPAEGETAQPLLA